jgi:murein DD-endopeptidase MepM/ murein hydrolase activator NlpD
VKWAKSNKIETVTMFGVTHKRTYFYSDDHLQIREIPRFRARVAAVIVLGIVGCFVLLLGINYVYHNFLRLGNDRMKMLIAENRSLRVQVENLTTKADGLAQAVSRLQEQGNQMRLMVNLAPIDSGASAAGTGGASDESMINTDISENASVLLTGAMRSLQKLSSEVNLQEQSYEQILKKYEFNKGFFRAIPALKPMDGYYSPHDFGLRMHPVLGIMKTHEGIDIVNDVGTPVYAAGDGVVEMAGHSGGGYGIVVVIRHGFGYQTLYGHLSKTLVRDGQRVHRGDLIAKSGRTGLVSGPHLHYEVRYNGVCQNPIDYFLDDVSANEYRRKIASNDLR